jgi:hypothetical protein
MVLSCRSIATASVRLQRSDLDGARRFDTQCVLEERSILKKFVTTFAVASALILSACGTPPGPRYHAVHEYSEGLAAVQAPNGRWGFINSNQQWVIPAKFEEVKDFKNGKAPAKLNGRWGFINRAGAWQ